VLETLSPAERLAFVLHDMFAVPFDDIARIVDRSPAATRQLASRARRRVQGERTVPDVDLATQRELLEAFLAAGRNGDFEALLAVLDPDVVLRAETAEGPREVRGADLVARQAMGYARLDLEVTPVLVNGSVGAVTRLGGELFSVGGFTVQGGRIVAIDILAVPERLARIDLTYLGRN